MDTIHNDRRPRQKIINQNSEQYSHLQQRRTTVNQLAVPHLNKSSNKTNLDNSFSRLSLQESTEGNSRFVQTRDIHFSQKTLSRVFSDGRSLDDAVYQLTRKEITPEDFPPIRVVRFDGHWISLDNRRLRVFLDAFVDKIPVIKLDLKDVEVAKEFWAKKSNKSLSGGGTIRAIPEDFHARGNHFEEGIFVFNKHGLNWTLEMIKQSSSDLKRLPDTYSNRDQYFESFKKLIFEEARAILQNGIEQAEIQKEKNHTFELIKFKPAKNAENPTEIKFSPSRGFDNDIQAGDALLLEHTKIRGLKLLALANYSELSITNKQISFKVVLDHGLLSICKGAFEEGEKWKVTPIGSLITLQRMFDACTTFTTRTETFLEKSIWSGKISPPISKQELSTIPDQTSINATYTENSFLWDILAPEITSGTGHMAL